MSKFTTPTKKARLDGPSTSPWKTPQTTNGKAETVRGYIIHFGQETLSKSNNKYYDVVVQRSKSDISTIRIMINATTKDRAHLMEEVNLQKLYMVELSQLFPSENMYFYNGVKGSQMTFQPSTLSFDASSFSLFTRRIADLQKAIVESVNVECQIKYVTPVRYSANGGEFRNAAVYDGTGHMYFTIWHNPLFTITEGAMVYITNLKWKDYFGFELVTTKDTTFSYSANEAIQPISKENLSLHVLRGAGGA